MEGIFRGVLERKVNLGIFDREILKKFNLEALTHKDKLKDVGQKDSHLFIDDILIDISEKCKDL